MKRSPFVYKAAVMFCCAALFFSVSIPFRMLFSLFTITEIRPASALTPVFGLLFGHYGALAAAIGNLCADVVSGYPPLITLAGFFMQFLYGYIPYKLWHSFCRNDGEAVSLKDVYGILKYVAISFCSVIMVSLFLYLLLGAYGWNDIAGKTAVFTFFNNSIFCMILGVPLLICAPRMNLTFFSPRKQPKHPAVTATLFGLFIAAGIFFFVLGQITRQTQNTTIVFFIVCLAILCLAAGLFPADARRAYQFPRKKTFSLTEQISSFFLFIGIVSVIISATVSFYDNFLFVEMSELWDELFFTSCISLYILFALIFVILRFVERTVTRPVELLSDIMVEFAEGSHTAQESVSLTASCKQVVCKNNEIRLLENALTHTIIEVQDYTETLERVTAEREKLEAELEIAAQIQLGCLPPVNSVLNEDSPFNLDCFILPAKEIGGDFYDFFFTESGLLVLLVADVSGKGVPAALFMMHAKTLINEYMRFGLPPAETFARVNERLLSGNDTGMFVTAFMAVIDTRNGQCTCVNAGHNPPLFKRSGGRFELFPCKPSFMLAGLEDTVYEEEHLCLNAGDALFLYTDGVTEALCGCGEFFGEERLLRALNEGTQVNARDCIVQVKNSLHEFVCGETQSDDITMLSFIYQPNDSRSTFLPSSRS